MKKPPIHMWWVKIERGCVIYPMYGYGGIAYMVRHDDQENPALLG